MVAERHSARGGSSEAVFRILPSNSEQRIRRLTLGGFSGDLFDVNMIGPQLAAFLSPAYWFRSLR